MSLLKLLVDSPLYLPTSLTDDDAKVLGTLYSGHFVIDCYCPECKSVTTLRTTDGREKAEEFRSEARSGATVLRLTGGSQSIMGTKVITDFALTMYCARNVGHVAKFYFRLLPNKTLIKIGQTPSLYEIASAEVRKYQRVLGESRTKELQQAIGLAAHGIGIGSFAYLRRIVEALIEDHRDERKKAGDDIPNWDKMRTAERIDALKDSLPAFLVSNKMIHGLLSMGIHGLTEEQCMAAFPVMKQTVMLILQQDYEKAERKKTEQALAVGLNRLSSTLKSGTRDDSEKEA